MCLIVFAYKQHPDFDLILAANRDEFYERPTRPAQFWKNHPSVLAGKDLKAGGTWMGITQKGCFSALTNFRDPALQKDDPPSRGFLVLDYLLKDGDPEEYLKKMDKKAEKYNGFNLLCGTMDKLMYYSNHEKKIRRLEAGVYGLSNHLLDTPWPKVQKAKKKLTSLLKNGSFDKESLFSLLVDTEPAPEGDLPRTGIPKELERAVSSVFIKTDIYGTRNSTIIQVGKDGKVFFEERRFKAGTRHIEHTQAFSFLI